MKQHKNKIILAIIALVFGGGGYVASENLGSATYTEVRLSTGNSTTTPLADGATYTGTGEINTKRDVMVTVYTDAPGSLSMQFSTDGTNWDSQLSFNVRANFNEIHVLTKGERYYRTVYTDDSDSDTQTYFRLQTQYGDFEKLTSPYNGTIADDQDALVTRSLPSFFDIARGKVQGVRTVNKFGEAPNGVQSTATDVWDGATSTPDNQIWHAFTEAQTVTITSSSANDTANGTGMRTARIYGLQTWDSAESSELINMNGTTGTTTSNTYVCIHRIQALTSGGSTTGMNIGNVHANGDTDGNIIAMIPAGQGQTNMAIYCLGSVETAYMTQYYGSLNKASGAVATIDFRLRVNPEPNATTTSFRTENVRGVQSTGTSDKVFPFAPYKVIPGPAIIKVQGTGSADDLEASAGFGLIIEEN